MHHNLSLNCVSALEFAQSQGIQDPTHKVVTKTFFTVLYGTIFVFGLFGNGGVFVAVVQNKRLRSASNIFLLNMILTDLMLVVTAVPVTPWYALTMDWQFGSTMCHLMPISNTCSVFIMSWSLMAIAIDKFLHIIDPTKAPITKRQASFAIVLIWFIASLINVPHLLSYKLVDGSYYKLNDTAPLCGHFCEEANWNKTVRQLYGTMVMLLQFVVPMAIISFCYFRILSKVSKDMIIKNAQFAQSLSSKQRIDAINRKKRVNYILIAMVVTFIGCWLPLTVINLVKDWEIQPAFLENSPFFWPLMAHATAMSLVIWNPLLFFWLTRKQKRMGLSRIINTSEVVASFASRLSSLRRTTSTRRSSATARSEKLRRRQMTVDSEASTAGSRPLIIPCEVIMKATNVDKSTMSQLL